MGNKYIKTFENYTIGDPESEKRFMSDLYNVGKTKAVGYLPLKNISIYGGDTVENVIDFAKSNGLEYSILNGEESTTSTGALYLYDYNMLQSLLEKHSSILEDVGIPTEPHQYIKYIEKNTIFNNLYPEAYRVIGLTFNDKRFR